MASIARELVSLAAPAGPEGISREESLHPHAEIGPGRLEQEVQMVIHDDIAEQLPSAAHNGALQTGDQSPPIRVVADDLLTGVAPRHDMVDGALVLDAQSSWHDESLRAADGGVKGTKNKI